MSIMLLAINFLLEGQYLLKIKILAQNPVYLLLPGFYLLHAFGLIFTELDWAYAMEDLRIKLPLLALPIIIGASKPIEKIFFHYLGLTLSAAIAVSAMWPFVGTITGYFDVLPTGREFSRFDSHIRLSLLIILCIAWLPSLWKNAQNWQRWVLLTATFFMAIALGIMQSFTGFGLIVLLGIMLFYTDIMKHTSLGIRQSILWVFGCLMLFSIYVFAAEWRYFLTDARSQVTLSKTINQRPYQHWPELTEKENGYRVWLNVQDEEAQREWEKRSKLDFYDNGYTQQRIRATLYRFLSSKGLPKDSAAVASLSDAEIAMIENGATNYRFGLSKGPRERAYSLLWELDKYLTSDENPQSNSLAQRFEFWRTAGFVFLSNPVFGVGTGDIMKTIEQEYITSGSKLSKAYRLRPHNQFLTTAATFGVFGLIYFIIIWIYPLRQLSRGGFVAKAFWVIAVASMLFEDTLETQLGATFISLFYTLFLGYLVKNKDVGVLAQGG
jgi:hypothetical protein